MHPMLTPFYTGSGLEVSFYVPKIESYIVAVVTTYLLSAARCAIEEGGAA